MQVTAWGGKKKMTAAPPDGGFGLWEALVATSALLLNAAVSLGVVIKGRQSAKAKIDAEIAGLGIKNAAALADMERRIITLIDAEAKNTGEVGAALRQKMTEVQFFVRDNFVEKAVFNQFVLNLEKAWTRLDDKLEKRDERFEKRDEELGRRLEAIDAKLK